MNSNTRTITAVVHQAIRDLQAGRITPDQYRAIMRGSRAVNGEAAHLHAHNLAVCAVARQDD